LPIAVGILASNEIVMIDKLEESLLLGELSLDGTLRKIKGGLPIAVEARKPVLRILFFQRILLKKLLLLKELMFMDSKA
jgi:magnesium chelatase family protein